MKQPVLVRLRQMLLIKCYFSLYLKAQRKSSRSSDGGLSSGSRGPPLDAAHPVALLLGEPLKLLGRLLQLPQTPLVLLLQLPHLKDKTTLLPLWPGRHPERGERLWGLWLFSLVKTLWFLGIYWLLPPTGRAFDFLDLDHCCCLAGEITSGPGLFTIMDWLKRWVGIGVSLWGRV